MNWPQVRSILDSLKIDGAQSLKIGLLNFNSHDEIREWVELTGQEDYTVFLFEHVHESVRWEDLYPEWIDEEEVYEIPKCPFLPMPHIVRHGILLDLIVVKIPSSSSNMLWSRDVARLHVQLSAAHVATSSQAKHVLAIDSYRPLPNLFRCAEIKSKGENAWLFELDLEILRKRLSLPFGSCELSVPSESKGMCMPLDVNRSHAKHMLLESTHR
jgi:hypothetical protein